MEVSDKCRFRCVLWVCACECTSTRSPSGFSAVSVLVCVFVRALCGGRLYNINVLLMGDGVRPKSGGPSPRTRRRLNYLSCSQGVDSMEGVGGIQDTSHSQYRETEGGRKKKEREDKGGMDFRVYAQ